MNDEAPIRPRFAVILPVLLVFLLYMANPLAAWADDTGPVIGSEEYERFDQYVKWSD
ncbi:MAG: hypothetical protein WCO77_03490 [bacterium]